MITTKKTLTEVTQKKKRQASKSIIQKQKKCKGRPQEWKRGTKNYRQTENSLKNGNSKFFPLNLNVDGMNSPIKR